MYLVWQKRRKNKDFLFSKSGGVVYEKFLLYLSHKKSLVFHQVKKREVAFRLQMTTYTYIYFSLSLLLKERKNFWVYVFFGYLQHIIGLSILMGLKKNTRKIVCLNRLVTMKVFLFSRQTQITNVYVLRLLLRSLIQPLDIFLAMHTYFVW